MKKLAGMGDEENPMDYDELPINEGEDPPKDPKGTTYKY